MLMTTKFKLLFAQLFVAVLLFAGITAEGNAQTGDDRWVLVEKNSTEEYYFDSLSVTQTGDTTFLWVKTIYTKKIKDEDGEEMKSSINSLILFCGKNKYTMTDIEVTYKDDSKKEIDYQEKNKAIKPETIIDKLYIRFCR